MKELKDISADRNPPELEDRVQNSQVRMFSTGATRDQDATKPDLEGYLSPLVLERFAEYMTVNRVQPDGRIRDSDNWQKGMPLSVYMKSGWRHFLGWWKYHRFWHTDTLIENALCGLLFNVMGYLHELLKGRGYNGKN